MEKIATEKINFYSYNLVLPLIFPILIFLIISFCINKAFNSSVLSEILRTLSLFLLLSFFTNVGYWGWKGKGNYGKDEVSSKITLSLMFGIASLVIYIVAIILSDGEGVVFLWIMIAMLIISIVLVPVVLMLSLNNPGIEETDIESEKEKSEEVDTEKINDMEMELFQE